MIRRWVCRLVWGWCRDAYFGSHTFGRMEHSVPGVRDFSYDERFNDLHVIIRGKPRDEWSAPEPGPPPSGVDTQPLLANSSP